MDNADLLESYREIEEAARRGEASAQYQLGEWYAHNPWIPPEEAAKWLGKAADQGHAGAQCFLGMFCQGGYGEGDPHKEAVKWFRKAARQKHRLAQRFLGTLYLTGTGVKKNPREAMKWFRRAALEGDTESAYQLAVGYTRGWGIKKNIKKGIEFFHRAAHQDYPDAQYHLGLYYQCGKRVPGDKEEALKWLALAAAQGHEEALKELKKLAPAEGKGKGWEERVKIAADHYAAGIPREPKDPQKETREKLIFKEWLTQAAEGGDPSAQAQLANLYYTGLVVPEDYQKAFHMYSRSAQAGNPCGLYGLGIMYEHGRFVNRDRAKAFSYFERAAELGDTPSQIRAAAMLFLGQGVAQDFPEGEEYLWKFAGPQNELRSSNVKMFLFELAIGLTGKASTKFPYLYYVDGIPEKRKEMAAKTFLKPFFQNRDDLFLSYDYPKSEFGGNGFALGAQKIAWKSPGGEAKFKPYGWKGFQGMALNGAYILIKDGSKIPFLMPEYEQQVLFNVLKALNRVSRRNIKKME
jgi:TPR repeat protein